MKYTLFTTTTCPKCPAMKEFVESEIDFEGEMIDNTTPDFGARVAAAGVANAPSFLVFDDDGEEIFRGSEIDEIREFLAK